MTSTPETPASVDGGPDLLPCPMCEAAMEVYESEKVKSKRWFVRHPGEEGECIGFYVRAHTREEAVGIWNRRPRDAALREEGRVQERAGLEAAREALVAECYGGGDPHCRWCGINVIESAAHRDGCPVAIVSAIEPQPDASQGSAPVARSIPSPEDCPGCAKVARHPGEGYSCAWHPAAPQDAPGRLEPHDWISQHAPGVEQRTFCSRCGADLVDEEAARWCKPTQAARGETGTPAAPQGSPLPGGAWEPDYGDVNAVATIATVDDSLWKLAERRIGVLGFNHSDGSATRALFYLFAWRKRRPDVLEAAPTRNPPEGGALEGEMAGDPGFISALERAQGQGERRERAAVVRWLRDEALRGLRKASEYTQSWRRRAWEEWAKDCDILANKVEAGEHQPPVPAIPQSGAEKEGSDG